MILNGRSIKDGYASGQALVTSMNVSLFGGIDPDTGIIIEHNHELEGQCVSGRVLVFPTGKGSTVGSYTLYRLKKAGLAPAGIINAECEPITAVGCIISEIPCMDHVDLAKIVSGMQVIIDSEHSIVNTQSP